MEGIGREIRICEKFRAVLKSLVRHLILTEFAVREKDSAAVSAHVSALGLDPGRRRHAPHHRSCD